MRRLKNRVWKGGVSLIFCCFFGVQNHVYCQTTIQDSSFAKAIQGACPAGFDTSNTLLLRPINQGITNNPTSQSITLKPGFQAQAGMVFTAEIRGCN